MAPHEHDKDNHALAMYSISTLFKAIKCITFPNLQSVLCRSMDALGMLSYRKKLCSKQAVGTGNNEFPDKSQFLYEPIHKEMVDHLPVRV